MFQCHAFWLCFVITIFIGGDNTKYIETEITTTAGNQSEKVVTLIISSEHSRSYKPADLTKIITVFVTTFAFFDFSKDATIVRCGGGFGWLCLGLYQQAAVGTNVV